MGGSKINMCLHTDCNCVGPGATLALDLLLNSAFADCVANGIVEVIRLGRSVTLSKGLQGSRETTGEP